MDDFSHEVLGDVSDETRWLKILRTKDLVQLSVTAMICVLMLNIFPKTGFYIFLEIGIMLAMVIKVVLGLLTKSSKDYLKGGGVDFLELIKRKKSYRRSKKVYSLGTEEKYNGVN